MYWYYICDKSVKRILYFYLMENNYSRRSIKKFSSKRSNERKVLIKSINSVFESQINRSSFLLKLIYITSSYCFVFLFHLLSRLFTSFDIFASSSFPNFMYYKFPFKLQFYISFRQMERLKSFKETFT